MKSLLCSGISPGLTSQNNDLQADIRTLYPPNFYFYRPHYLVIIQPFPLNFQTSMKSWKRPPSNQQLANYIDSYWYLEKNELEDSFSYPRLIPNPLTHLILTPSDQSSDYTIGESRITVTGSHLITPCNQFIEMDHHASVIILGIVFRTGAAYSCFPETSEQKQNCILKSTDKMLSCLDFRLSQQLVEQSSGCQEKIAEKLDRLLMPLLSQAREDRYSKLIRKALHYLKTVPLAELEDRMNCSRRTLERSFVRVTGFTMKQYEAMTRLDSLIRYLYKNRSQTPDWADLALHFGFSDQPHLIRELKKTIGTTPARYAINRNLTIDTYGDFEK